MRFAHIVMGVVMVAQTTVLCAMSQQAYENSFNRPLTRYRLLHNHLPTIPECTEKAEKKETRIIKKSEYKCVAIMSCCWMGMRILVDSCFPKSA